MPTTYRDAPELREIASHLIEEHRPILTGIPIRYIWRDVAPMKNGQLVVGSTSLVKGRNAFLIALAAGKEREDFFLIEISHDMWEVFNTEQRFACLHHYLTCCGIDQEGAMVLQDPEVVEFNDIARIYGPWRRELETFAAILQDHTDQHMATAGYSRHGSHNGGGN